MRDGTGRIRMLWRPGSRRRAGRRLAAILPALALLAPPAATGIGAGAAEPLWENPWLERRILNVAHRGGVREAPENTLYALKTSFDRAAHAVEFDVHVSADGVPVVIHDSTVDRTTGGSGVVHSMTVAELKALDAAHWFVPGAGSTRDRPEEDYVYRGIATGDAAPPAGFTANDFTIPTLEEVLQALPGVMMYVELKADDPNYRPYEAAVAELLHRYERGNETLVASFNDASLQIVKALGPEEVGTVFPLGQAAVFWGTAQGPLPGVPNPQHDMLSIPPEFLVIEDVVTEEVVSRAQANNHAVHVWTINTEADMRLFLDMGVDGILTDAPMLLAQVLEDYDAYEGAPAP